ncbi:MAG: hypothetical protein KAW87_08165 [Candidatus Cloacimonetes bacterium]|nr:hypothetical protein [Candidatus Cloacimonadota bacterium]
MNLKQPITSVIEKIEQNKYWILSFCLLIVFDITFFGCPNTFCGDFWEHTAALEELSHNLASPKNPQLLSDIPSPRYMPYILILAIVKNITGLNVFSMMILASIATFLIFSIGLYFFTKEYFNDKDQAFYTIIVMLFFWGTGFGLSNAYNFNLLKITLCYPSIFAFSLSFSGFYFVLKYIKTKNFKYYFYSLVLGFIIFLSHSPTGSFFFLAILLLVLSERNNIVSKLTVFCLPIIIVISSCFWPYFSMTDLMFGSMALKAWVPPTTFYSPHVIYRLGPVLLGIPIVFNYFIKREYKFVYYGFASCFLIYIVSGIMKIPFGERYIFFFAFFLHLAIARELRVRNLLSVATIKQIFYSNNETKKKLINITLALILFSSIAFNIGWSYAGNFADKEDDKIILHEYRAYDHVDFNEYNFLKEKVGRYDVVMSDKTTSWLIPTYSGKAVCIIHLNPLIPDLDERLDAVGTFFDANTTSKARLGIIKKYNVSYILLNLDLELFEDETIVAITELGNITFQNSHFVLIEIEANNKE